ncbi:MAG TPA: YciI family protein [Terriglobia bacterium]|nr:YciI family protein [Terriglobia bacterium]
MKFVCLGYYDEKAWDTMSQGEQNTLVDECLAYDDVLKENNRFVGGDALQPSGTAATVRYDKGKVVVTDGPYSETKEQIGGILILEARDLNHAIELMSKHPGVKAGPFEIRPVADMTDVVRESEKRRGKSKRAS